MAQTFATQIKETEKLRGVYKKKVRERDRMESGQSVPEANNSQAS